MEIWKDAVGLEDVAQVSNWGRVKTKDRFVNPKGKPYLIKGKIKKPTPAGKGYLQYYFNVNGLKIRKYAHVMVLEAFSPPLGSREEVEVNHIDHDKENNFLENLEWNTHFENLEKRHKFYGTSRPIRLCKNCSVELSPSNRSGFCKKCASKKRRKVERPSLETLEMETKELGFVKVGRKYGVSDNAIRKWLKSAK